MTMTVRSNPPDASGRYFVAGEFVVKVVTMKDTDYPTGERLLFAVIHEPSNVVAALTAILSGAIRGSVELQKDLEDALKDPAGRVQRPEPEFPGGFPRFTN
jgi:hypothetical protein